MVSTRAILALALMLAATTEANQRHGYIRDGDTMAMVLSENAVEEVAVVDHSCDATNGQGCQRQLKSEGRQDAPPEFIPTHEWQDILPKQAIPPGLYIRVNLSTGKKEAKLLD